METWLPLLLPFGLVLARVSAFFAVLPIFGWAFVPMRVRIGLMLLVSIFFAGITPPVAATVSVLAAVVLLMQEIAVGLALGLAAHLVFLAARQGGRIAEHQMGLSLAAIIDPLTGEQEEPMGVFLETILIVLFLGVGGHHLLLRIVARSFAAFPLAATPDTGALAAGVLEAGSLMLLLGLKLAAPVLAAFAILAVILGVLARALPEMDILLTSLPLRVGLGLFMTAALLPALNWLTNEIAKWMNALLT